MMRRIVAKAYTNRAIAPAIIERNSAAAYNFPSVRIVNPRVARATEGAAANRPAKLLGFSTSPKTENSVTMRPPTMKRKMNPMPVKLPLSFRADRWESFAITDAGGAKVDPPHFQCGKPLTRD
jgi:hypothetical protein